MLALLELDVSSTNLRHRAGISGLDKRVGSRHNVRVLDLDCEGPEEDLDLMMHVVFHFVQLAQSAGL